MAALAERHGLDLVDLRHVRSSELETLLKEEAEAWDRRLHWDFSASADLVTRYTSMRALDGLALRSADEIAGYVYWVTEGRKALIGDLYVREPWRSPETEAQLLQGALEALGEPGQRMPVPAMRWGWVRRIEGQLLQLATPGSRILPQGPVPRAYSRLFMLTPLDPAPALRAVVPEPELKIERWSMRWLDESASLIARVYEGHVDSEINDQYRSVEGARRFIQNVTQYPGCGLFLPEASWIGFDAHGAAAGIVLTTRVSGRTGHIAQICVAGSHLGGGTGYELMRRAMTALASMGLEESSLTVTEENRRAIRLYERLGFKTIHRFDALVWAETE